MKIAIKISDDLLRDSAVRQIVTLCLKANDLKTARILFRAIQAISIREDVLNDHPILRRLTTGQSAMTVVSPQNRKQRGDGAENLSPLLPRPDKARAPNC